MVVLSIVAGFIVGGVCAWRLMMRAVDDMTRKLETFLDESLNGETEWDD